MVICSNSKAPAMAPKMTVMATCRALRMGFLWTSSVWLLEDCICITPYLGSGSSLHQVQRLSLGRLVYDLRTSSSRPPTDEAHERSANVYRRTHPIAI